MLSVGKVKTSKPHDPNDNIPVPSTPSVKNPQSDTEFRRTPPSNQNEVIQEEEFEYDYEYDSEDGENPPVHQSNTLGAPNSMK